MGVHISFVQSVGMDKWSEKNIRTMLVGGNARARSFFRQHGLEDMRDTAGVAARYSAPAAKRYAKMLADEATTQKPEEVVKNLFKEAVSEEVDFFANELGETSAKPKMQNSGAAAAAKVRQAERQAALTAGQQNKPPTAAPSPSPEPAADDWGAAQETAVKPKARPKIRMGAKKKSGVKKLGGAKKIGATKKVAQEVDWDGLDAKLPDDVTEPAAVTIEPGQEADALKAAISQAKATSKPSAVKKADGRLGFGQLGPKPGSMGFGSTCMGFQADFLCSCLQFC